MESIQSSAVQISGGFFSIFLAIFIRLLDSSVEEFYKGTDGESQIDLVLTSFISGFIIFSIFTLALVGLDSGVFPFSALYIFVLILANSLISFGVLNVLGLLYIECLLLGFVETILGTLGAVGLFFVSPYLTLPNFLVILLGSLIIGLLIRGMILYLGGV